MKTLLVNGCSFGHCWSPSDKFVASLDCDNTVNISKPGTSFQRTCRSTVEWIAQNGNPARVMIPITFAHRWEMPIGPGEQFDKIDGNWIPLQSTHAMSSNQYSEIELKNNHDEIKKLSDLYYGLIPNVIGYWDKIFTEIITISAFLEQRKIPYLMWDMCNEFDESLLIDHPHVKKTQLIKKNKMIMNIFSFCGNKYMWRHKGGDEKDFFNEHHGSNEYNGLEDYILQYMNDNLLLE